MEILVVVVLAGLAGGGIALGFARVLARRRPASAETPPDATALELAAVKEQLNGLTQRMTADTVTLSQRLEQRLEGIDLRMTEAQSSSANLVKDIFERLGSVTEATTSVAEQARQFTLLQDLLRPPKTRGGVGEAMLSELLRQVLPPDSYATQHRFDSGVVVDAAVKLGGRVVCIDSKFPLANYERICEAEGDVARAEAERAFAADVSRHLNDIAARYIVPDEDTFEFAVMYVPAEGVYGEVLRLKHRQRSLCDIARDARVIPMSPLTMYSYLQTICMGLRGLSIEKSAQKILDFCGRLQTDMEKFAGEYEVLGTHISRAYNKYDEADRKLGRFRESLDRISDLRDDEDEESPPSLEVVGE